MESCCRQNESVRPDGVQYPHNYVTISVTRLADLLDFGQVLKPLATINLPHS